MNLWILIMVFTIMEGDREITNMITIDNWSNEKTCNQELARIKRELPKQVEVNYAECVRDLGV